MHTLEEIIKNQKDFVDEITAFLKKDLKEAKQELINLKPKSEEIIKLKEDLQKRLNKFKLIPEIEKYFITKKNTEPKYYALWNDELKEVEIFKFNNEKREEKHEDSIN